MQVKQPSWTDKPGIQITTKNPQLHADSWTEAPVVIQATLAPWNLIQIGAFTGIYGGRLGHCKIGRYCSIAPGVDIASDQHPSSWLSTSMIQYVPNVHGWGDWIKGNGSEYHPGYEKFSSNSTVEIGHDVWIGQGVFVKSGVKIGTGSIIAAHAVVTKDIPPYSIATGVPAKVIRKRFSPELVNRMLTTRWWDYVLNSVEGINFSDPESALDQIEGAIESGNIKKIKGDRYSFGASTL